MPLRPLNQQACANDTGADLTNAVLTGANLRGAKFRTTIRPDGSIKNSAIKEPDREPRSS